MFWFYDFNISRVREFSSSKGSVGFFLHPVVQSKKEGGPYRLLSTVVYKTCQLSVSIFVLIDGTVAVMMTA